MRITQRVHLVEAFARVAALDILLMIGLYILRNRGWRSWFDAAIGCLVVFYINGRVMAGAFAKAFPDRKSPRFWEDL